MYKIKKNPFAINHRQEVQNNKAEARKFAKLGEEFGEENPEEVARMMGAATDDSDVTGFNKMHLMTFGVKKAGMTDAHDEKLTALM